MTAARRRVAAAIGVSARRLPAACLALLLTASSLSAQTASAAALKAAFVYNFAKFAEWPADAAKTGPLTICVLGDMLIANELDGTVKGRAISGREVVVLRVQPDGVRACHVLCLSGLDTKRALQIVDDLKNAPVLTVSDADHFAEGGGIAGLFVDDGKMRFAINVEAAKRARLQISSRLLSLAKLVKDDHVHP
jgi:YfiR/HmsC-like